MADPTKPRKSGTGPDGRLRRVSPTTLNIQRMRTNAQIAKRASQSSSGFDPLGFIGQLGRDFASFLDSVVPGRTGGGQIKRAMQGPSVPDYLRSKGYLKK
jgi:hypothetical protein